MRPSILSFFLLTCHILPCWSLQHPTGFITLEECIKQGACAKILLQEPDSQQFILSLQNGVVINEGGVITQDGKILKDTETYGEDQHRLLSNTKRNLANEESVFFEGRLAVISSPGQENWYHWLFQVLPRIKILVDSEVEYDKIYLENVNFKWQRESLDIVMKLFKIPEDRLFLKTVDSIVEASTLIVPSVPFIPSKSLAFPLWLKEFIITSFLVDTAPEVAKLPERIYISRSNASCRSISNEAALARVLVEKGFVVLHLEEMSVRDQARAFHHAKIIIGPHGSGFTNLIFCKPKTLVIEIDHGIVGDVQRSFYKQMEKIINCRYCGYYPDLVSAEELEQNIHVDLSDFRQFCKKWEIF